MSLAYKYETLTMLKHLVSTLGLMYMALYCRNLLGKSLCYLERMLGSTRYAGNIICVKTNLIYSCLFIQFFTTEPYACEPSSLPKYPPSKEMDVKLRDEEARRFCFFFPLTILWIDFGHVLANDIPSQQAKRFEREISCR